MKKHCLGEYIRQRRVERGLTQGEVCSGICEPITLSRLENGRQTPSCACINAILQRLGLPSDHYCALLSHVELKIEALKKVIVGCSAIKDTASGWEHLHQLEQIASPDDHLTQQFILRSKALLGGLDGSLSPQEKYQLSLQALRITVPQFELDEIGRFLYTTEEIKLINQLSVVHSQMGDNEKAADISHQLLEYIQKYFSEDASCVTIGMLPLVLYQYVRALDLCGRYEEAASFSLYGQQMCVRYQHYQFLNNFLEIRAESLHFLGRDAESAELYRQAYYISRTFGIASDIRNRRAEAKKYLGLIFED
ncbi:MAG: helix-turn-helix domain-containing protein [Faecalibacterium sp.]